MGPDQAILKLKIMERDSNQGFAFETNGSDQGDLVQIGH